MEIPSKDFSQVTLDRIASASGLPPNTIETAAYALAPKLEMLIGKDDVVRPPTSLFVGFKKQFKKQENTR